MIHRSTDILGSLVGCRTNVQKSPDQGTRYSPCCDGPVNRLRFERGYFSPPAIYESKMLTRVPVRLPCYWPQGVFFVKTQLRAGLAFSTVALWSSDPARAARNTAKARAAFDVACQYVRKVRLTLDDSKEIDHRFEELRANLVQLGQNLKGFYSAPTRLLSETPRGSPASLEKMLRLAYTGMRNLFVGSLCAIAMFLLAADSIGKASLPGCFPHYARTLRRVPQVPSAHSLT